MQNSVLDLLLFSGNDIHELIKLSEDYKKNIAEEIRLYERITATLNDEQKKDLDKFSDIKDYSQGEVSETYLKEGVKLGIRLLLECLYN